MPEDNDTDPVEGTSIAEAIEQGIVRAVFQPVVDLVSERAIGWEAFARVGDSEVGFDQWLQTATDADLGAEFQFSALRAIAAQGVPPDDGILFVNVSAELLHDPRFLDECTNLGPRLAVDVRGAEIDALTGLDRDLDSLAAAGIHLSIDDTTAASLSMIAEVRPSFVKIDPSVVRDVVGNPVSRSIIRAYLAFAESEDIHIIAEGVERLDQLEVLRDLGIRFAQGYLFGLPSDTWSRPSTRRVRPPAIFDDRRDINERFEMASDLHAVAEIACADLAVRGVMPSVYVEREGVLRCIAQMGYWQVLDGIPVLDSVMARAFRTGQSMLIVPDDVESFIAAAPGIVAELAVPLRVGRRMIGVLNVESTEEFDDVLVAEVELVALAMEQRLEVVGAKLEQSALHRLAQANVELSSLNDISQIEHACARLACEISGLSSAVLTMTDDRGVHVVKTVQGPLSAELSSLPAHVLITLRADLERVSSCLTSGDNDGLTSVAMDSLRAAGASSIAAFPIRTTETGEGLLIVADHAPVGLDLEEREAMEMLAREVGRSLDMARVMADLRDRATRDPLTGLGNLSSFQEALTALGGRRRGRWAVAMADVDGFKSINDNHGHLTGDQTLRDLAAVMNTVLRSEDRMYRVGGDEFAAILHDVDEEGAAEVGRRICEAAASVMSDFGAALSMGIALPVVGESPTDFLDRADKMLYLVKSEAPGTSRVAPPPEP
ncbi:EAL domain-containing protein [Actinospongicola halichondriae]|uniref:EAL domain-containing protein n=1 Tax=Actinospongicola halichondriae TaxID=3236844 RepID=UPI003D59B06D